MACSSEFMSGIEMLKVSHGKIGAWEEQEEEVASPQLWEKQKNPHGVTEKQLMMRYMKEMMELLGDAPENTYELSLRDIVDIPWKVKDNKNENESLKDKVEKKRNKRMNGRVARSENLGNGLLLKMFVPRSTARTSFSVNGAHSNVIPKAMTADQGKWSSSSESNNSSNHTGWRKMSGCVYPCFTKP